MRHLPILLLAGACSGDKAPVDSTPPEPAVYEPTWAGIQQLIDENCARCHPATNGIDLIAELPNMTTTTVPGYLPWVTPGEPDNSWMWLMVSGQAGVAQMPADGLLPAVTVDAMRVWIEDGAPFQ